MDLPIMGIDFEQMNKDYAAIQRAITLQNTSLQELMHNVAEWGRKYQPDRSAKWNILVDEDWQPDIEILSGWFLKAMQFIRNDKDIHYVYIFLGDCPDTLLILADQLTNGDMTALAILKMVQNDNWSWAESERPEYLRDDYIELFEGSSRDLPVLSKVFDLHDIYDGHTPPDIIWEALVRYIIASSIQQIDLDYPTDLGMHRTAIPIFIGFEDCYDLIGILTHDGWQKDLASIAPLLDRQN